MIEEILPRRTMLARRAPTGRDREARPIAQVIIANPDQAVFVFACAQPAPHLRMLDRFLVVAEAAHLPAIVCANKCDLVTDEAAKASFGPYAALGYPVLYTSATRGDGVGALRSTLRDRLSVLAGPSGVGKSSLLNAVEPGLGLKTRAVSDATTKGRHATVFAELVPLHDGGYVADTPGLRALALWDVEPEELDGYFVEMRPYAADCDFSDCAHLHEPGCAVRAAVRSGAISAARYDSYLRIRQGEE
jgi:ribosome biogenesis GTPase